MYLYYTFVQITIGDELGTKAVIFEQTSTKQNHTPSEKALIN